MALALTASARPRVQFGAARPEFEHVAEHRDAPALRTRPRPARARSAPRASRPDWRCSSRRSASPRRCADLQRACARRGRRRAPPATSVSAASARSAPASSAAASTASEFIAMMPAGRAELVGDVVAAECRRGSPSNPAAARCRSAVRRLCVCAERDDAGDAARFGALPRAASNCALSRLSTAAPPGSSPAKISALASAIASMPSKNSRCTGSTVVMIATCGRTMLDQRRDLAGMVHADLEHARSARRRAARQRQRHAPMIVERRDRGMGLALRARARARSASLVEVLPTEPVTAMTCALEPRPRGAREIAQGRRARRRRSAAARRRRTASRCVARRPPRAAAPAFSAAATKSWPSCTSPLMAKNASPGASVRLSIDMPVIAVRQRAAALGAHRRAPSRRRSRGKCAHATLAVSAAATAS